VAEVAKGSAAAGVKELNLSRKIMFIIMAVLAAAANLYSAEPVAVLFYVTAIWSPYCPDTENACLALLKDLSPQSFCPLAMHIGDEFYTSAIDPITQHYQFQYVPAPVIDGSYDVKRGIDYDTLQPLVASRLAEQRTVALLADGRISPDGQALDVSVNISSENPLPAGLTLIVFLREDNLFYGGVTQQFVCRDLQEVPLPGGSQSTTMQLSFALSPSWNPENLSVGAFLQDMDKSLSDFSICQGAWDGNLR
jgi:hypothetical protein